MASSQFLNECETFFGTKSLYKLLALEKGKISTEAEIKKAYYKMSLVVHPDRCIDIDMEIATKRFQIVNKAFVVLSNSKSKQLYDETGAVDENSVNQTTDWFQYWRVNRINIEDIESLKSNYIGSQEEVEDVKKAYYNFRGNLDYVFESVPFTTPEDEPRIRAIIDRLIADKQVLAYENYLNETKQKQQLRMKRYKREQRRFYKSQKMAEGAASLSLELSNSKSRMGSLIEDLERRYGKPRKVSLPDTDDEDEPSTSKKRPLKQSQRPRRSARQNRQALPP